MFRPWNPQVWKQEMTKYLEWHEVTLIDLKWLKKNWNVLKWLRITLNDLLWQNMTTISKNDKKCQYDLGRLKMA